MAKQERIQLSGYKSMWLFVMFDLPVLTKEERKEYTRFRKKIIGMGFSQLQLSVYARFYASEESSNIHRKKISLIIPPGGLVRLISITDIQFGKMDSFYGDEVLKPEKPPSQIAFF